MAQSVGPVKRSSAYDAVFEQHLKDCGIYIYHPSQKPKNLQEILKELAMPRSDLSPSNFSDDAFAAFKQANRDAINESTVMTNVFKTIIGSADIPHCVNLQFDGLEPLLKNSVDPFPDFYDGSSPDVLDQHVREKLKNSILPSHNTSAPCLPNFFMEVKGPGGNGRIAERQICYDGAAGARGMHRLRSFIDEKTAIDSRAYTISAVYLSLMGLLTIYTTHPVKSTTSKFEIEYYMTQVRSYILTNSPDSCREGLSALRNARDWAKDRRDELIAAANNKQPPQDSFSSDELA